MKDKNKAVFLDPVNRLFQKHHSFYRVPRDKDQVEIINYPTRYYFSLLTYDRTPLVSMAKTSFQVSSEEDSFYVFRRGSDKSRRSVPVHWSHYYFDPQAVLACSRDIPLPYNYYVKYNIDDFSEAFSLPSLLEIFLGKEFGLDKNLDPDYRPIIVSTQIEETKTKCYISLDSEYFRLVKSRLESFAEMLKVEMIRCLEREKSERFDLDNVEDIYYLNIPDDYKKQVYQVLWTILHINLPLISTFLLNGRINKAVLEITAIRE